MVLKLSGVVTSAHVPELVDHVYSIIVIHSVVIYVHTMYLSHCGHVLLLWPAVSQLEQICLFLALKYWPSVSSSRQFNF